MKPILFYRAGAPYGGFSTHGTNRLGQLLMELRTELRQSLQEQTP